MVRSGTTQKDCDRFLGLFLGCTEELKKRLEASQ